MDTLNGTESQVYEYLREAITNKKLFPNTKICLLYTSFNGNSNNILVVQNGLLKKQSPYRVI